MAARSAIEIDWAGWLARWDAQQASYLPHREDRFDAIVAAVGAATGHEPRILDIGSGPGSLARRVLDRLPNSQVVALDNDPVLLELGRNALAAYGDRLQWLDADLCDPTWLSRLPDGARFHAEVSATALHWLTAEHLPPLYRALATLLPKGGIFLDGDHIAYGSDQVQISLLATGIRTEQILPHQPEMDDWSGWWTAIEAEPALAEAFVERTRRRQDQPAEALAPSYEFHRAALHNAGFSEVGTLWQRLTDRVLVAIR